ncbi:nucleotidyltransferase family protein [Campylobacter jejuni]|uniref:nucleotidyltransferase family protein n=1 Tax=Campylobacter jejuni TaxID=197 RepID=UPI000F7FB884|nr:nucleotidyltransferase family protein [Campylobacter jejuni]RTK09324.1 alcohol dehydrogenase [Campylobacter jejuni]HEF7931706.1 nucleotidyltransferase family protein [Campylobacter jejuni]
MLNIKIDDSIMKALELLGTNHFKLLIVENLNQEFIGIVTDSDIRKGLLQGMSINDPIEKITQKNPIVAKHSASKEELLKLSIKYNISEIPIVNDDYKVIRVERLMQDILLSKKDNKIIIMVGGLGVRLKPLTDNTPKPMLKIGNKPILEIILEKFKHQGYSNFIFCVNYKADVIENYFKDGSKFNVRISYIKENQRLGTAGALSLLEDIGDLPFLVTNGDIVTDIDYSQIFKQHILLESDATMCVKQYEYKIPYGVIKVKDNAILSIREKPTYNFFVNSGIYILSPEILHEIPKNKFYDMPQLFKVLIKKKYKVSSYNVEETWIDIGMHQELKKVNDVFSIMQYYKL